MGQPPLAALLCLAQANADLNATRAGVEGLKREDERSKQLVLDLAQNGYSRE